MEKPTHYIELTVMSLDGEAPSQSDHGFVLSKAMAAVHRHIENSHEVAVSFPQMSNEPTSIGGKMRIFGNQTSLAALLAEQMFASLIASACCVVGRNPIREVPEQVGWIKITRDRTIEKSTPGFLARAARRREKRGHQSAQVSATSYRAPVPFVVVRSHANGGSFRINLKLSAADDFVPGPVSGYGLSVPVPHF